VDARDSRRAAAADRPLAPASYIRPERYGRECASFTVD
jgi:hypothetical protein